MNTKAETVSGKFRKRPVVIDAVQCGYREGYGHTFRSDFPKWLRAAIRAGTVVTHAHGLTIYTLEGPMNAAPDDWIIRGVRGELYPCKPEIFAETYETVSAPESTGKESPNE